jgi:hypothetical protein
VTTAAFAPDRDPESVPAPTRDRGRRTEVLLAAIVAVVLAALGLPLGLLWRALAPRVEFVMTEQGPTPLQQEPEGFVADDGWYVLITLAAGVLAAILVWLLLRRQRGPLVLVGLVVGSIAGGVLTLWLGHHIGYAHYRDLIATAPVGTHIFRPPDVRSAEVGLWFGVLPKVQGTVLLQAVGAATAYMMLASFHVEPDLRRPEGAPPVGASWEPTGWTAQQEWPAPPGSDPGEQPRG